MNVINKHNRTTSLLARHLSNDLIANWLLNEGYYPEPNVFPPTFQVRDFELNKKRYTSDKTSISHSLEQLSFPKSNYVARTFSIQHPYNYHDIVYLLMQEWNTVCDHLFNKDLKIFSYSFPIPVTSRAKGQLSKLRSGRLIYQWIEMAERDLISESHNYKLLIRSDISNFYNSVYSHSVAWALHGKDEAFDDRTKKKLIGNKIDKIIMYANDRKSIGIPVGSALSDLLAEILLTAVDIEVSRTLNSLNFIAVRFKDDYRVLCNTEDEAKEIIRCLSDKLWSYNLLMNEHKTNITRLPKGLYRQHNRDYQIYSLKENPSFKEVEFSMLKALDIHRDFPGTSILEKFLSELFDKNHSLSISFSKNQMIRDKEIARFMSLLLHIKCESEKTLCYVLAIWEQMILKYGSPELVRRITNTVESEIESASANESVFQLAWYIFFDKYMKLSVKPYRDRIKKNLLDSKLLKSVLNNRQEFFKDTHVKLYTSIAKLKIGSLAEAIAVFNRK